MLLKYFIKLETKEEIKTKVLWQQIYLIILVIIIATQWIVHFKTLQVDNKLVENNVINVVKVLG